MIAIVNPTRTATLFWRLAVLRRQLRQACADIAQLRRAAIRPPGQLETEFHEDLLSQLHEASEFIKQAIDCLAPANEHADCEIDERCSS